MSNQMAIKYRPTTLDEVVGHEKVKNELKNRSSKNMFPKVTLISGNSGVGKDCLAFIIAKTIQCQNPKNVKDEDGREYKEPCNSCNACQSINSGRWGSNNTYFVDCANSNKEDIQKIEKKAFSAPFMGGNKQVFIIDEFQALVNERTKQSVLTMLENPNDNAHFILTTMDITKVPVSTINRTTHFKLKDLKLKELSDLAFNIIANLELDYGIEIPDIFYDKENGSMGLLLNSAQGSGRMLISNMERVVFGELWNSKEAGEVLGVIDDTTAFTILLMLVKKDLKVFSEIQKIESLEQFFYLSYETLVETVAYMYSGEMKNEWKKSMADKLISVNKKNIVSLLDIYQKVFSSVSGKYFKKAFFVGSLLQFFREDKPVSNNKLLQENNNEKKIRRRVVKKN